MIIVTLVATLAGSMVWQQWRAIQVEAAERARAQSAWILSGALDWARLILREDAKAGSVDHLGEPWAVPLAEARLSTFLAADKDNNTDDAPDAFLSGAITDAHGALQPDQPGRCHRPHRPAELASARAAVRHGRRVAGDRVAHRGRPARRSSAGSAGAGSERPAAAPPADPPLMPQSVAQLGWLGIDADRCAPLEPYVVLLPDRAVRLALERQHRAARSAGRGDRPSSTSPPPSGSCSRASARR